MKIKDKTVLVYDIESFPNLFTCSILNSENNKLITYEISEDKNDLGKIVALFQLKEFYFCGFNNKSYDDVLINYLIIRFDDLLYKPIFEITWLIKSMSDKIIKEPVANWVDYKHAYLFNSFDLMTMSFSAKNRVGLKEGRIPLATAVIDLTLSPKSKSAEKAIDKAQNKKNSKVDKDGLYYSGELMTNWGSGSWKKTDFMANWGKKQGYDVDFSNFRYSESLIKSYQRIFMGKSTVSSNIIETTFYDDDDNIIFIEDVPSGYFEVANGSIGEGEYNTVWPYAFVNSGGRGIF